MFAHDAAFYRRMRMDGRRRGTAPAVAPGGDRRAGKARVALKLAARAGGGATGRGSGGIAKERSRGGNQGGRSDAGRDSHFNLTAA